MESKGKGALDFDASLCDKQTKTSLIGSWQRREPWLGSDALGACSARLEEEDSHLTKVEVDEMLGLMGHVGAEVASHDAMPGGVVLLVELLLDKGGDVLLDVEALKGLGRDVDSVLLHILGHVSILDDGFSVRHCFFWCRDKVCLSDLLEFNLFNYKLKSANTLYITYP